MITEISINNFKSLVDFELKNLDKFTCLIGLNGSGKTTLLQALDFIAHLVSGDVGDWLKSRSWKNGDLVNQGLKKRTVTIRIVKSLENEQLIWNAVYNVDKMMCTWETLGSDSPSSSTLLLHKHDNLLHAMGQFNNNDVTDVGSLKYEGSILSAYKYNDEHILKFIDSVKCLKSLELLSPSFLRRNSRPSDDIGSGGETFSGFVGKMNDGNRQKLLAELQLFYPHVKDWSTRHMRSGWTELYFSEGYGKFVARHINDGMLRIMAILSQKYSKNDFLLFDEIENGINQELVEKLINALQDFNGKQVMVTTHSGLVLNYLPDNIARENVVLLYRDDNGYTKAVKFFELKAVAPKLGILGPGEAMGDTDLTNIDYAARIK